MCLRQIINKLLLEKSRHKLREIKRGERVEIKMEGEQQIGRER